MSLFSTLGPMSAEEAHTLKKALDKADENRSHSNVRDVLQALHDFPGMNELILKETKLGKALQTFKRKYDTENPEIGKYVYGVCHACYMSSRFEVYVLIHPHVLRCFRFITVILKQWTKIAKSATNGSAGQKQDKGTAAASPVPDSQPSQSPKPVSAPAKAAPAPAPVAPIRAVALTPQRQKIQDLLTKTLSSGADAASGAAGANANASTAIKLAKELEQLSWDTYPCDASGKQTDYSAKIRTLNFNLKKNDSLRARVLQGSVTMARLICMTADELASKHIMEQRRHAAEEDEESRRQDWLQEHKKEIIANAVHGAGGKIEDLMNEKKDEEWFDFTNELEEVSDDD